MIYFIGNNLFDYSEIETCTTEYCFNYLSKQSKLGLDIETSRKFPKGTYREDVYSPGLDPYVSRVVLLQIGDEHNQFLIDTRVVSPLFLQPILENRSILKVGHNLKFEGKHLFHNYTMLVYNVWDTMICERILYNGLNHSYSLEAVAKRHLNAESFNLQPELFDFQINEEKEQELDELDMLDYKPTSKFIINKSTRMEFLHIGDKPFTLQQLKYGVDDILIPLQLHEIQKKGRKIGEELYLPEKGFYVENAFTQVLARIELRGVKVDVQGWLELYELNRKTYVQLLDVLDAWVVKYHSKFANQLNIFSTVPSCSIEWSSSKQVIELCKDLGFCPREFSKQTKQIEYTVGAKAMFKLLTNENKERFFALKILEFKPEEIVFEGSEDYQTFILNYLICKKYQQLTTTFGKAWLNNIHPITGRVHTNFIQLMNTGRLSSVHPNLQQLPNGVEYRKLFIAEKGNKILATDLNAQEKRISAQVSEVQSLRDFFKEKHPIFKDDIHSYIGTKMFQIIKGDSTFVMDKKLHKDERNKAKSVNFKLDYGSSAFTISKDLGITEEEGELFVKAYFDSFPGLEENFNKTKKLAVERGWVELDPYTKKRYFYPDFDKMNAMYKEFFSHFGDSYKALSKEEKTIYKKELYIKYPKLRGLISEAGKLKGKLERTGLNYRIQGNGATMVKIATLLIEKANFSKTKGILILAHDEAVEEWEEELAEEKAKFTVECMIKSGTYSCPDVPMDATPAINTYWEH